MHLPSVQFAAEVTEALLINTSNITVIAKYGHFHAEMVTITVEYQFGSEVRSLQRAFSLEQISSYLQDNAPVTPRVVAASLLKDIGLHSGELTPLELALADGTLSLTGQQYPAKPKVEIKGYQPAPALGATKQPPGGE